MNHYIVYFETMKGEQTALKISIKTDINRPNNPTDDEIIQDYLSDNYGSTIDYETFKCAVLCDEITIE